MTRDDIIRMAREAGLDVKPPSWGYTEHYHFAGFEQQFERFASLVAAVEREACAKACEWEAAKLEQWPQRDVLTVRACAAAIRARGET